jgi:ribosomal protein L37E
MNDSVRDEVRAALARTDQAPLRSCPRCGRQERTRSEECAHCGYSYFARPPAAARRRRIVAGVAGLIVLAAVAVGAAVLIHDRNANNRRDRAEHARLVRAEIARLRRVQAPHRGSAVALKPPSGASAAQQLAARHRLLLAVQDAITADARHRVTTGELSGTISHSECGPFLRARDAVPDDRVLSKPIGRYDCVAVQSDARHGGVTVGKVGYAFVAALDFRRFNYVICRNSPAQGEAGRPLAFVRLDRACLATNSRQIGSGYVDPEATP